MADSRGFSDARSLIFMPLTSTRMRPGKFTLLTVRSSQRPVAMHSFTDDTAQTIEAEPSYLPAAVTDGGAMATIRTPSTASPNATRLMIVLP